MKRKVITLLMAFCMVFIFTGCNKNKDNSASNDKSVEVTEASRVTVTEKTSEDSEENTDAETSKPAEPLAVEDSLGIDLGEGEEGAW